MVGPGFRFRSDDLNIEASDGNTADRRPALYGLQSSDQTEIYPENSLPAFLSDYAQTSDPNEIIAPLRRRRRSISSQILAGTCGAAAMGALYALVSSDAARSTLANAQASIAAVFPAPSIAAQLEPTRLAAANGPKSVVPPSENQAIVATGVQIAAAPPSRDDVKNAYQNALQGSAPAAPAAVATVVQPEMTPQVETIRRLDPGEVAAALTRSRALIASGDVAAARLVLRHPADSGDAQAAMALAETYDPAFLQKLGVHGIVPDVAKARGWYEKASKFGAAEATRRLEILANR